MKSEPGNHLTSPFRRGHKFPLYRAETAAAEANEAFTARSSGAIFTKRAISGFHLTPNLSSNAQRCYSFLSSLISSK